MKALSIKPPWPWLIINRIKPVENRTWYCSHRGPLLIHASKGWDQSGYEWAMPEVDMPQIASFPEKRDHVFGAIVGHVEMVDCVNDHPSPWFFGPWGFEFEDARKLRFPIPYRGQRLIFEIPDQVLRDAGYFPEYF